MNKWLFTLSILLLATVIKPQVIEDWVARYNGPGNQNARPHSITVDESGNSYVTGYFFNSETNTTDFFMIKYDANGDSLWVQTYNGPGNGDDFLGNQAFDNEGNVYVAGYSGGGGTLADFTLIKYDSNGNLIWSQRYNGPDNKDDRANTLAIDSEGNVYIAGVSTGIGTREDYATIKYNTNGVQQWVKRYNGPGNNDDDATAIAVDNEGNVYVTGYSKGNGTSADYATIKYNSNGDELWVKRYNGLGNLNDSAWQIKVDTDGNVYVTGISVGDGTDDDFVTIKYSSNGDSLWVKRYNGPGNFFDRPNSMVLDNLGNIYVTGSSFGDGTATDYATIKYNSDGDEQWVQRYSGPGNLDDGASTVKVDIDGNVYVSGYTKSIGTGYDYATLKYDSNGDSLWIKKYNGPENVDDYVYSLAINNLSNVYITGASGIGIATIKYSQTLPGISKPILNSKFISGETDTIKWVDAGWNAVNIKCKTNFETPIESEIIIAQGIPIITPEFIWNVPDTILSFRSKIIIENADNITEKIESDIFRIKPYVLTRLNADSTYYEYRKNRDQWGFSNVKLEMWPEIYYSQFNYQGTDPFTELNLNYSQVQGDGIFAESFGYLFPDWVSWVNTFTINACYNSTLLGLYKPSALLSWLVNPDLWNGSCFGIAVANALAFSHKEQFQTRYTNFPAFDNPISVKANDEVRKVISELFSYQFGNPHKTIRSEVGLKKLPTQTLSELKEMLRQDNAEIRTLSFLNNGPGGGGHAVLAYGLKRDATIDGLYYVQIYDNSNPNSNIPIQISTVSNGGNGAWGTAEPSWAGWGGNKWLYLRNPTEQYLVNPTLAKGVTQQSPFILGQDVLEINNTTSASIQIRDNMENKTGFINNLIQLAIPGSTPLVIDNGSVTPPYGYSLPRDNYSIIINGFAEDTLETFFFTGNKSFMYERGGAVQTQTDRLFFDGGVSITNPDAQIKTVKLLNLVNETTQEKLTVIRQLELTQNDSIKIENPDSNKVKLISYGTAKNYDIELNYVTESEFGRFVDSDVSLPANTSHIFVPVWTDLTNSELQVLVDIGNDGTIDDTLTLVNQVTGIDDDQGSLLTPNSYNLAQNFPNPFNPSTKISWQSPVGSHQTLKIYDVLGNEVATLVNEYREAGSYEITFDAAQLSSGIYFYKLQAGSFVETKKMILIK